MAHHPSSHTHLGQLRGRLCGTCEEMWHITPHPNGTAICTICSAFSPQMPTGQRECTSLCPPSTCNITTYVGQLGGSVMHVHVCACVIVAHHTAPKHCNCTIRWACVPPTPTMQRVCTSLCSPSTCHITLVHLHT